MKRILIILVCFSVLGNQKLDKKYQVCKASCMVNSDICPSCVQDCQRAFCRATCYIHNQQHCKYSKECIELEHCMNKKSNNKAQTCNPKPCLDRCNEQKNCLFDCNEIYDVANSIGLENTQEYCTSQCFCFKENSHEFLGKVSNKGDYCNNTCGQAFAKFEKNGEHIIGICG